MRFLRKTGICILSVFFLLYSTSYATNWGLWYGNGLGKTPRGEDSKETLAQYGAYFVGDETTKTIYLTFDCGYENGNTAKILDILKKCHIPATFFMVGDFLQTSPQLVKRMVQEGHLVGNHTKNHPNMTKVSKQRFIQELDSVQTEYEKLTGQKLAPFYRPPEGSYTYDNLKWANELDYHTILWSVAYADWDTQKQPSLEQAKKTLNQRVHSGAIILLHAVSSTNTKILEELLTSWKLQGYQFAYLTALPSLSDSIITAIPSGCTFEVNGMVYPITAYEIKNENYIKLRDLAEILKNTPLQFSVDYNGNSIAIRSGKYYQSIGTELFGIPQVAAKQGFFTTQTLNINDQLNSIKMVEIDNHNYVHLRTVAK